MSIVVDLAQSVDIHSTVQSVDVHTTVEAMKNPFKGQTPKFSIFGTKFDTLWKDIFGAAWAIGIIWIGTLFVPAIIEFAQHKGGNHPQQMQEARSSMLKTGGAMAGMVGLGVILGTIIKVVG